MRKLRGFHYTLLGKIPIPCDDILLWGLWFSTAERHVARDVVGPMTVSTVFLGMDHNYLGPDPLLFETMIFVDDASDIYLDRCSTWGQAEAMHAVALAWAKDRLSEATVLSEIIPAPTEQTKD